MYISRIAQPVVEKAVGEKYDLVVCSSGYESRSSYLASKFVNFASRYVCLGHAENKEYGSRRENDKIFNELGYEQFELSGNSSQIARQMLNGFLDKIDTNSCRIMIDISSMTRAWYGGFVHALSIQKKIPKIIVDFAYVPAIYSDVRVKYPPNEIVAPLEGFSGLKIPDRPTALVIGLGQEPGRAIGIKEELDPQKTIVFYTFPSIDERYTESVLKANRDLIRELDPTSIFTYPLNNSIAAMSILESVCLGLLKEFRVVVTSNGPKIFSLYCCLLAAKYPEISVWRITAGAHGTIVDHRAREGSVIILEIEWTRD